MDLGRSSFCLHQEGLEAGEREKEREREIKGERERERETQKDRERKREKERERERKSERGLCAWVIDSVGERASRWRAGWLGAWAVRDHVYLITRPPCFAWCSTKNQGQVSRRAVGRAGRLKTADAMRHNTTRITCRMHVVGFTTRVSTYATKLAQSLRSRSASRKASPHLPAGLLLRN